ncbi:MAG: hypothetical protein KC431_20800 [Myxococcales bacterium]|nr:hypothetical protein [Myxococcales bacterium]
MSTSDLDQSTRGGQPSDDWAVEICTLAAKWAHRNMRYLSLRWQTDEWHDIALPRQFTGPDQWDEFVVGSKRQRNIDDFWMVLEPFAQHMLAQPSVLWVATALRFGVIEESELRFHYWCKPDIVEPNEGGASRPWMDHVLATKARSMGWHILLTSDLGLNQRGDGRCVIFTAAEDAPTAEDTPVKDTTAKAKSETPPDDCIYLRSIQESLGPDEVRACLMWMQREPGAEKPPYDEYVNWAKVGKTPLAELVQELPDPEERLANYVALMSHVVGGEWTRIVMIPHAGVATKDAQPGGVLICESGPQLLDLDRLKRETAVASAAMWPWKQSRERYLALNSEFRTFYQWYGSNVRGLDRELEKSMPDSPVAKDVAARIRAASALLESYLYPLRKNASKTIQSIVETSLQVVGADLRLDVTTDFRSSARELAPGYFPYVIGALIDNAIQHNPDWANRRSKVRLRVEVDRARVTISSPAQADTDAELEARLEQLRATAGGRSEERSSDLVRVAELLHGTTWKLEYDIDDSQGPERWIKAILGRSSGPVTDRYAEM